MIQFIPGLEPGDFRSVAPGHWDWDKLPTMASPAAGPGSPDSVVADWSVAPEDWGYFLTRVWDEWFKRDYGQRLCRPVRERHFADVRSWPTEMR